MRRIAIATLACAALVSAASAPLAAQEARDVVSLYNAAYAQGDFNAFMANFAEDAVVVVEGRELRGRAAIARVYSDSFAPGAPRARVQRQGRVSGGGVVLRESLVFADGREECCTTTAIWVEGGEITRMLVDSGTNG